jgi:hypothetical protein
MAEAAMSVSMLLQNLSPLQSSGLYSVPCEQKNLCEVRGILDGFLNVSPNSCFGYFNPEATLPSSLQVFPLSLGISFQSLSKEI